jgi:hypothetical protein
MSDTDAPEDDANNDTLVLDFDPPIKLKQASYSQMVLVEPTAKMVRQAEGRLRGGVNVESLRLYQIALIVAVSKWPQDAVEELPIRTLDKAGSFLARFTNLGQITGTT